MLKNKKAEIASIGPSAVYRELNQIAHKVGVITKLCFMLVYNQQKDFSSLVQRTKSLST